MDSQLLQSNIEKKDFLERLKRFPPFYTLQDHGDTRKKQLMYWSQIIHEYFKANQIQNSSVSELNQPDFKLFEDNSTGIPKRLNKDEITIIINEMHKLGNIQWVGNSQENFTINWFSSFELADCIYIWAKKNHYCGNKMESLQHIIEGDMTEKKFYGLPEEQVLKALYILEQNGKGEVKEIANRYYFKFL